MTWAEAVEPSRAPCVFMVLLLWSGDAGVETAEEAVEPAEPDINQLCTDMFGKMSIFLQGELTGLLTHVSPLLTPTLMSSTSRVLS